MKNAKPEYLTFIRRAIDESIARGSWWTRAHGYMIDNIAEGILSARIGARISAFGSHTSLALHAIFIDHTLWATACVRVSEILW